MSDVTEQKDLTENYAQRGVCIFLCLARVYG